MPFRIATHADVPRIAELLAASFGPDRLFQVMFPHQKEYPEDFVRALRLKTYESWWDYAKVFVVSYETVNEGTNGGRSETDALVRSRNTREVLTGIAEWEKVGQGWEDVWGIGWWDPRRLIRPLVKFCNRIQRFLVPDRASARPTPSDPYPLTYYNFIQRLIPFTKSYFSPPWRRNHWSLEVLAVHPDYHYRGIGRDLAAWGLERAKADGVPAVVVAAKGKETFYRRCGFELLVGYSSEGIDDNGNKNPLGERAPGGGAVLWTKTKEDEEAEGAAATTAAQ